MAEGTGNNFGSVQNGDERSPVLLRIAEKELKERNFNKAAEILETVISAEPSNASACFLLGKAYTGAANFRLALQYFKRGSELIRSEKTYQYYLKQIELSKREAENESSDAANFPQDYKGLLNNSTKEIPAEEKVQIFDENIISETLAKIYLSQGQAGEAVRVYERLKKKYPLKKLYFEAKIAEITSGVK